MTGSFKFDIPDAPLVSYVTVVRNNQSTLERTIVSVQAQTYSNVEHIVVDGASTDGTLDIIKKYSDRLDYFASEKDKSLYDALNKAIPLARGRLICVLNSDDWLEPDAALTAVNNLPENKNNVLILSAARVNIDDQLLAWIPSPVSLNSYFSVANCCHNAIYATREAYASSGPYDINYEIAADFKWIMKCYDAGVYFVYLANGTLNYSLGGISGDGFKHRVECQRIISERFPFLDSKEVFGIHYCFYQWRERLVYPEQNPPKDIELFLQDLKSSYSDKADFLEALSIVSVEEISNNRHQKHVIKLKIKNFLIKYPLLFSIVYKIYKKLP